MSAFKKKMRACVSKPERNERGYFDRRPGQRPTTRLRRKQTLIGFVEYQQRRQRTRRRVTGADVDAGRAIAPASIIKVNVHPAILPTSLLDLTDAHLANYGR